jgi:hypothetical protein
MTVSEAKRLKALEDENAKLKKLLVEQMLDIAMMKELLAKNGGARLEAQGCRASEDPSRAVGIASAKQRVRGTVCSAARACQIAVRASAPAAFAVSGKACPREFGKPAVGLKGHSGI